MCKGRLGGGGGEGVVQAKEDINHLTKIDHFARWAFLLYINSINIYSVLYHDKCTAIVYLSLTKIDHFARWAFLLYINSINIYSVLYHDKCTAIVYLSLTVYFPHMLLNSEHS